MAVARNTPTTHGSAGAPVARPDVTITAPADDTSQSAQERYIRQQWRDVKAQGLEKTFPDSLNLESSYCS